MGDYAHINCRLTIKDEYIGMIKDICDLDSANEWDEYIRYEFIKEFTKLDRYSHIPYMDSAYLPWDKINEFLPISGIWHFTCCTKGFTAIDYFIQKIIPEICLTAEVKYTNDFMYNEIEYKLEDGKMVKYGEEDYGM